MKKLYYICLTAIVLLAMNNNKTYSQNFVTATYSDLVAVSNIYDVENTGNDVRLFKNSTDYNMYVMTWDGNAPAFAWDDEDNGVTGRYDIDGTNYGTVTDPDIVLYDCNVMWAQIVYLLEDNGVTDVYYESWRYDPINNPYTWVLTNGPTAISTSGNCTCPNVDVDEDGNTVVVWEENGEIYASAGDIEGNFQTPFYIADGYSPDVALNRDNYSTPQYTWVNFTFISDNGNYSYLNQIGADYDDIYASWPALGGPTTLYTADLDDNEYFGKPRIAGPVTISASNSSDYEIVVEFYQNGRHYIQSHNPNNANSPAVINDNLPVNISSAINKDPAVSYCGGHIIVTWTYDDSNLSYSSGTIDVISRQLISYDGTITTTSPFNIYSVVNRNTSGVQGISSVAGRFSSTAFGEQKLVTFFNEDNSEVNYKIISFSSTQFRVKQPEIQADVYPNPTSNIVNIKIDTEFEIAKLELYNLQGQRLIQKEIYEQKFELDVSELNPGIYKLRVSTENSSDTKNISIIR